CRTLTAVVITSSLLLAGCETAPPPPPAARPAAFIPLGVGAAYLSGDVIGGYRARAAKMRAAKIRPLSPVAAPGYMAELDRELRPPHPRYLHLRRWQRGGEAANRRDFARDRAHSEDAESDFRRRPRPHRHDRNAGGQQGAFGQTRGRRGDLSCRARRCPRADRI